MKWTSLAISFASIGLIGCVLVIGVLRAQEAGVVDGRSAAPPAAAQNQPASEAAPAGAGAPPSATNHPPATPALQPRVIEIQRDSQPNSSPYVFTFGVVDADNPELAEWKRTDGALAQETAQLTDRYAETEDAEKRSQIKAKLAELLTKHFEVQQQIREQELAAIEARVKKLRDVAQKRREAQQQIVNDRLEQLLREADGLGWTPPANSVSGSRPAAPSYAPPGAGFYRTLLQPAPPGVLPDGRNKPNPVLPQPSTR